MNIVWEGPTGESMPWELESHMRESYPTLFPSDNFRGRKLYKWGRVLTPQIRLIDLIEFFYVFI